MLRYLSFPSLFILILTLLTHSILSNFPPSVHIASNDNQLEEAQIESNLQQTSYFTKILARELAH